MISEWSLRHQMTKDHRQGETARSMMGHTGVVDGAGASTHQPSEVGATESCMGAAMWMSEPSSINAISAASEGICKSENRHR